MTTPRWFFANLVRARVSRDQTGGRFSILEIAGPPGDTPPLHVHHEEDEAFHLLEGSARIHVGEEVHELRAGDSLLAPKGVPHTYIAGDQGARWLVTTSPGDFERFVLAASRPAETEVLPPAPPGPPSQEEVEAMSRLASEHGIEILGPPGALPS
jgi:quercetin dioxygenase-like cupin family protein